MAYLIHIPSPHYPRISNFLSSSTALPNPCALSSLHPLSTRMLHDFQSWGWKVKNLHLDAPSGTTSPTSLPIFPETLFVASLRGPGGANSWNMRNTWWEGYREADGKYGWTEKLVRIWETVHRKKLRRGRWRGLGKLGRGSGEEREMVGGLYERMEGGNEDGDGKGEEEGLEVLYRLADLEERVKNLRLEREEAPFPERVETGEKVYELEERIGRLRAVGRNRKETKRNSGEEWEVDKVSLLECLEIFDRLSELEERVRKVRERKTHPTTSFCERYWKPSLTFVGDVQPVK
ncbi:hypothetical protein CC80DRAFT_541015 [Byssothecium circinans]|uniref:Uncharacterized protein n=1 Tax=Byssothecium circinans TaxID=147558 RepID=A0A6A5T8B3_9PLEO|nr:hypothetical protein CC80DRAFT_541015 [Byssothecium circinans]